jgi:hypothetical protein
MRGIFSFGFMTILTVATVFKIASAQPSGLSPFFNASGDTREIDALSVKDIAQTVAPSVPLGYPIPRASDPSQDATPTVKSGPGQSFSKKYLESRKALISYSALTKTLTMVIPKDQNVNVSAHILNGQTISRFSTRKFLTAGTHTIKLNNAALATGIIVFNIEGDGFSLVKRINLMDGR